jgi:hypothetical protein
MAQVKPTSLLMFAVLAVLAALKYAYDKGRESAGMHATRKQMKFIPGTASALSAQVQANAKSVGES